MARDNAERDQQNQTAAPAAPEVQAPRPAAADAPAFASPETAAAREAARPPPAAAEAAAKLESKIALPSPVDALLAQMPIELPDDALAQAYDAMLAGQAAATGNEQAQSAVQSAPPAMAELAQHVQQGDAAATAMPLPPETREKMESHFGESFSDVKVVPAEQKAAEAGVGAATDGETIAFAPGRFDPTTKEGEALIAHELTHVVQSRGGDAAAKPHVAASSAPAEQEAEKVQDAVLEQGEMPQVSRGSAPQSAVHMGEAGVHQGIELEAAGVIAPGTDPHKRYDPDNLTPEQQRALEMYSGNFMRDFSQFQCPKLLNYLSRIPSATGPDGQVGANGAVALGDAVVQCIGILELGTDIGKRLITPQNVGVYEAEHHIDNPMGTSGAGDYITRGAQSGTAALAKSPEMKCIQTVDARGDQIVVDRGGSTNADTAATHAGSAVGGLQFENPSLYEVGAGGLTNHISNSTEHCKDRFLDAVNLGPTPEGRMNVGMGQHIVEDYFSHSNYIEVALNRYINDAVAARRDRQDAAAARNPESAGAVNAFFDHFIDADGNPKDGAVSNQQMVNGEFAFVDSLYDAQGPNGQQAITTGTFGGTDTIVSLGHVLLPRLPVLETALHKGVDSIFGVVHEAAKKKETPTWETIRGLLEGKGRNGAVAQVMLDACDTAGLAVPCPSGFHFTTMELGSLPLIGSISVPNGVALDYTNIPITGAITTGAGTYVAIMQALDDFERWTGIAAVRTAVEAIKTAIRAAMDQLAAAVRREVSKLIAGMIQELFNIDPKKAAHAGVGELCELAEEGMHELEERTSMETRMASGDLAEFTQGGEAGRATLEARVGPVRPRDPSTPPFGTKANPWVTVNPLPPSHSEIGKDHPPHSHDDGHPEWHEHSHEREELEHLREEGWDAAAGHDHNHDGDEHSHEDLESGSSFFELHYQLAVEADRHLMQQLSVIWGQTVTGGAPTEAALADAAAMSPLIGPEEPWVADAREYNARGDHAEHIAAFNAATGGQCLGYDGAPDPHLVKQWQEAKGLSGDGKIGPRTARAAETLGPASSLQPMAAGEGGQAVSHAAMLRAASGVAADAARNSEAAGARHMQSDERRSADMANPDVVNLMNLVDYFMSHPSASQWWVSIFDNFVTTNAEDVYAEILSRNKTRSRRGPE